MRSTLGIEPFLLQTSHAAAFLFAFKLLYPNISLKLPKSHNYYYLTNKQKKSSEKLSHNRGLLSLFIQAAIESLNMKQYHILVQHKSFRYLKAYRQIMGMY